MTTTLGTVVRQCLTINDDHNWLNECMFNIIIFVLLAISRAKSKMHFSIPVNDKETAIDSLDPQKEEILMCS